MDSLNAHMPVVDENTLNFPQPGHYTEPPSREDNGGSFKKKKKKKNNGGSSGRLWSMCLREAEKNDRQLAEVWKGEADTALIFAGLFTAVITISIVESYKWLSPDPDEETVDLLKHISRQLFNASNGIPLQSIADDTPFKPKGSAILVNVTWFCSMVICFSCSVAATITQQCVRRYLMLTQGRGTSYERARLRMYMFSGLGKFQVDRILQFLAMALHMSILLYCLGIVGFVFVIYSNLVPIALSILAMGVVIYVIFTVLPIFCTDSPIATPYTDLSWRLSHGFLFGFYAAIQVIFRTLSTVWPRTSRNVSGSRGPAQWLEGWVNRHRQKFLNGLRGTIELNATGAQQVHVDANTLEGTFTALVENKSVEIEDIAAWIPEYFDAYTPSGASETDLPLTSDQPPTSLIFGFRLHNLLKTSLLVTSDIAEEERKSRLRVYLKCLWYWVKAYTGNQNSAVPLPPHFPLPHSDTIRHLQAEQDPTAGMIGRCFGALVAKKLATEVNSHRSDVRVRGAKLESLAAILGTVPMETLLNHPGAICLANIIALTSSGMVTLANGNVPSEVLATFRTTVHILVTEDFLTLLDAELPPDLVASFHTTYSNAQSLQAPDCQWLTDHLALISQKLSGVSDERRARGMTSEPA